MHQLCISAFENGKRTFSASKFIGKRTFLVSCFVGKRTSSRKKYYLCIKKYNDLCYIERLQNGLRSIWHLIPTGCYLIDDADNLTNIPIEVKSGKDYNTHSALDKFLSNKDYNIKRAYVLSNEQNVYTENEITYMPIYYIMFFQNDSNVIEQLLDWFGRFPAFDTFRSRFSYSWLYVLSVGKFISLHCEEKTSQKGG